MLTTRIAAGALALVLIAGCSSITGGASGGASASGSTTSAAAKRTRPAPGSTVDAAEFTAQLKKNMESVTTASITMESEASGTTTKITGVADLSDKSSLKAKTETNIGAGTIMTISIGSTVYTKTPGAAKWKKSTTPTADLGSLANSFSQSFSSVTYVGTDTIDGEEVDTYDVKVDLRGVPVAGQLYLDQQGRTRRTSMGIETGGVKVKNITTFSNFNEPVSIEEPPASEVEG